MAAKEMVAFWLLPTGEAKAYLRALIEELAKRCDAPVFEPHVTMASAAITEKLAGEILEGLASRMPFELEIERIDFAEKYIETLFVQFRSSAEIEALAAEIQRATGSDGKLNPHLSLLYKEMPAAEKAGLARTISLPFERVSFEGLKAINTPHPITGREHIEAWRTLGERPLNVRDTK